MITYDNHPDGPEEGSFYQRDNGLWVGSVWVTGPDGTRKRKHVSGRDEHATRAKWHKLREQAARGAVPTTQTQSVRNYLAYWLEEVVKRNCRPATLANYTHIARTRIVPHLGQIRLDRLTVREIRAWITTLQKAGDSPRMVQVSRAVLRSALSNAVTEQLVTRNEAMLLRVPKPPRRRIQPWTAQEAKAFLKATHNHRLHTAFTLMLMLGLRRGEALGISWDDVDLNEGLVHLRHQIQRGQNGLVLQELKTEESTATLPLPTPVIDALLEREQLQAYERERPGWQNWEGTNLVTATLDGAPIDPRNLNRAFHTEAAKAGLRRIRVHDTRHTCASLLRSYGVDLSMIQSILRHTESSTTADFYLHPSTDEQRAALGLIAGALDHTATRDTADDGDTAGEGGDPDGGAASAAA